MVTLLNSGKKDKNGIEIKAGDKIKTTCYEYDVKFGDFTIKQSPYNIKCIGFYIEYNDTEFNNGELTQDSLGQLNFNNVEVVTK